MKSQHIGTLVARKRKRSQPQGMTDLVFERLDDGGVRIKHDPTGLDVDMSEDEWTEVVGAMGLALHDLRKKSG